MGQTYSRYSGQAGRMSLVSRQAVLKWIVEYIDTHPYPPTTREIRDGLGLKSTSTVWYHLEELQKTGHIVRTAGVSRGIRVTKSAA